MQRLLAPILVLAVVLVLALGVRIRAQEAALAGPAGGSGVVEGERVDVGARIAGRIASLAVTEGATVASGDVLAELDCAEPNARLAEADARLAAAEAQLEAARAQIEIASRTRNAASSVASASTASADVADTNAAAATREAARAASMGEYVSVARRDALADTVTNATHAREAAVASSRATRAQALVAAAQIALAEANARAAEEGVAAVRAVREVAAIAVAECTVHAPRGGVVESVFFEAGEIAGPGATLVRIVDLAEVTATFYLPNAELAAVHTGAAAHVVADAWPGRTFEGVVTTVGLEAEFTPRTIQTRTDRDRLVYPIEVRITNVDSALRPGMPVQVTLEAE